MRRTAGVCTTSTNRATATRTAPATRASRFMRALSYSPERLDSRHQRPGELRGFPLGRAAGEQPGPQRRFRNPARPAVEPLHVRDRNRAADFRPLSLVSEIDHVVMDRGDEGGRLRLEPGGVPAIARD